MSNLIKELNGCKVRRLNHQFNSTDLIKCDFFRIFDLSSRIFYKSLTVALYVELHMRRIECINYFKLYFIHNSTFFLNAMRGSDEQNGGIECNVQVLLLLLLLFCFFFFFSQNTRV